MDGGAFDASAKPAHASIAGTGAAGGGIARDYI
jgi:hypothetical protein